MLYDLTLICPFSRCQSPAPSVGLEQIKAGALTRLDKTRGKVNTGRNTLPQITRKMRKRIVNHVPTREVKNRNKTRQER